MTNLNLKSTQNCLEELKTKALSQFEITPETISRVHQDIIAVLRALGYQDLVYERVFFDFFKTDIYIPDFHLIVEVNGPNHYVPETELLNSASKLSLGFLYENEFNVMAVDNREWSALKGFRAKEGFFEKRFESYFELE